MTKPLQDIIINFLPNNKEFLFAMYEGEDPMQRENDVIAGYNQALADLRSRVPELVKLITTSVAQDIQNQYEGYGGIDDKIDNTIKGVISYLTTN